MDVPAWAPGEPTGDQRRLVGGVIVHDEMASRPVGTLALDLVEELPELARAVARIAFADRSAGSDAERGNH